MPAFPVGRHGRSLVKDRLEFNEEFRRQLDSERVDHSIEHLERILGLNDVVKVVVSRNLIPCIERLDLIEREGGSFDLVRVVEEFRKDDLIGGIRRRLQCLHLVWGDNHCVSFVIGVSITVVFVF